MCACCVCACVTQTLLRCRFRHDTADPLAAREAMLRYACQKSTVQPLSKSSMALIRDLLTCAGRGAELPSLVKAALLAREKRLDECSALLQVPQKSSTMSKRALPGAKAPYERAILTVASAAVRDGEPDDSAARQAHAGTAAAPAGNGVLLQVLL